MRRRMVMVAAAWLLLLGACGGDSDDTTPVGTGEDVAEQAEQEEDHEPSPLEEFMGWHEQDDEDWEAQEREMQELIVACMAEHGFEYQPVYWSQMEFEDPMASIEEEHGTLEYAEKYGYGVATIFEFEIRRGPETEPEDPNEAYLESLSEAEREAYFRVLHGEGPDIDPSLSDEEIEAVFEDYEPTGCWPEAEREVYGDMWWGAPEPEMEEFWQLEEDLWQRVEADPRVVEARSGWVGCMAEHGHDFAGPDEAEDSAWQRMDELWMSTTHPFGELSEAEIEAMSDDERSELESQPPDYDRGLVDEIRAYEIEVAVADAECRQEHGGDIGRVEDEVRWELEAELIEQHRELLERVRDEMP